MAKPLLALCSIPKRAIRDGWAGAYARLFLPFYNKGSGYWFASGQEYTFPSSTIAQDKTIATIATIKPDSFVKAAGVCI